MEPPFYCMTHREQRSNTGLKGTSSSGPQDAYRYHCTTSLLLTFTSLLTFYNVLSISLPCVCVCVWVCTFGVLLFVFLPYLLNTPNLPWKIWNSFNPLIGFYLRNPNLKPVNWWLKASIVNRDNLAQPERSLTWTRHYSRQLHSKTVFAFESVLVGLICQREIVAWLRQIILIQPEIARALASFHYSLLWRLLFAAY